MTNPLLRHLDAIGLPWQASRSELTKRFGVRRDPAYEWDVVEIATPRPLVDSLIRPLSFTPGNASGRLPPTRFSATAWAGDDARRNLAAVVQRLVPVLGAGQTDTRSANTVGHRWTFGASSLALLAWPADLQTFPMVNPSHERDPRLKTACSLEIATGWQPPLGADERIRLEGFVPLLRLDGDDADGPQAVRSCSGERTLEYVRATPPAQAAWQGWIGLSDDRAWLVFFGDAQCLQVPMTEVDRVVVFRMSPAKGPGGAWLSLGLSGQVRSLALCSASTAQGLDAVAADLASRLGVPLRLDPIQPDC
jgi:hypothetical protein